MTITRILMALSLLGLLAACGGPGQDATIPEAQPAGETSEDIGDHVVHFSAISTDQLPPAIASANNIVRSKNRAMLNISVIDEESGLPTAADVTVKTVNLTGQLKNVTMRRIDEPGQGEDAFDAIYYIGVTPVANRETLRFEITVTPEGVDTPEVVVFSRTFYTD